MTMRPDGRRITSRFSGSGLRHSQGLDSESIRAKDGVSLLLGWLASGEAASAGSHRSKAISPRSLLVNFLLSTGNGYCQHPGRRVEDAGAYLMSQHVETPKPTFKPQRQPVPGTSGKMDPRPDHCEATYRGSGRLRDKKALITGGDSGIG